IALAIPEARTAILVYRVAPVLEGTRGAFGAPAMPVMVPICDVEHVWLDRDRHIGRWYLGSRLTMEKVPLVAPADPWALGFAEDGSGLITDGANDCMVSDILKMKVFSKDGAPWMRNASGTSMALDTYRT
ncbi:unnamed protein product, partial [Prorocentrum cordatum]